MDNGLLGSCMVAYNEEIDQWTIYFKDDYTDYVIFPDNDITVQ